MRLQGVVGLEFIDSVRGIDELWDRGRSLEVWNTLSLHDVLDGVLILNEGYDAHLRLALTVIIG
jgi:hypothetical protein